ncbi:MAG: hypothetical protein QG670_656 [Thermoproteota archaeon]|nr:hypothetical protein [Thermoproteota archaeon]
MSYLFFSSSYVEFANVLTKYTLSFSVNDTGATITTLS